MPAPLPDAKPPLTCGDTTSTWRWARAAAGVPGRIVDSEGLRAAACRHQHVVRVDLAGGQHLALRVDARVEQARFGVGNAGRGQQDGTAEEPWSS